MPWKWPFPAGIFWLEAWTVWSVWEGLVTVSLFATLWDLMKRKGQKMFAISHICMGYLKILLNSISESFRGFFSPSFALIFLLISLRSCDSDLGFSSSPLKRHKWKETRLRRRLVLVRSLITLTVGFKCDLVKRLWSDWLILRKD